MPAPRTFATMLALTALALAPPAVATSTTTEVSVASDGTPGNSFSSDPSISADGSLVAFTSWSTNLVPGDTNDRIDVFVHDRTSAQTERVSVASDGTEGNDDSHHQDAPAISGDGRYVAFTSDATNLVAADLNDRPDVFVHDRVTGTTEIASVSTAGTQPITGLETGMEPAISADGRFVAFHSGAAGLAPDANPGIDVFVRDRLTGTTEIVSLSSLGTQGDGHSLSPAISADGRLVAFWSQVALVPEDTNGLVDVYVHDRLTGATSRVSVGPGGAEADGGSRYPAISADGSIVAFSSSATNLVEGDANDEDDYFLHDRATGTTSLVSVATDGTPSNDRLPFAPQIALSEDGRLAAFETRASSLDPADTNGRAVDVYLRDTHLGVTELVSRTPAGTSGDDDSFAPAISGDGGAIAFWSRAGDLVPGHPGNPDVFVVARSSGLDVAIDIQPGDPLNVVGGGKVRVAVLGSDALDAATVDAGSACFGDADAPEERDCDAELPSLRDTDRDGHLDLVLRFDVEAAGIDPLDTTACLHGVAGGAPFEACDAVRRVGGDQGGS